MKQQQMYNEDFEFQFKINGNIIVQRFFYMKRFQPKAVDSLEMKWCVDSCSRMIENDLKEKSKKYLWEQYNEFVPQTEVTPRNIYEKEDIFSFEIKIHPHNGFNREVDVKKQFSGNVYPTGVRYEVDIRPLISSIINEIQRTLSKQELTTTYGDLVL